jgi:DNA-binding transcriptional MerR regulator
MATVRTFHRYRGESSFTLSKLIAILEEQIPLVVPKQTKYRVTEVPTERTIRFYTAKGLVDKPIGRDGVTSLYGYRHLLQVLAVKYLQSHYLPLVKIRSLVENTGNRDLELIIPEIAPVTAAHRGITREDRRIVEGPVRIPAQQSRPEETPRPTDREAEIPADALADTWHRIEVGPGIELNIHTAALSAENRERLRGTLLRELGVLRGWFGPGGGKQ